MTKHAASAIPLSACAVAGIVVLSACSSEDGDATQQSRATSAASSEVAATTQPSAPRTTDAALGPDADLSATTFPVDLDRALAVAGDTAPGGTITKIELEFNHSANAWVWKMDSQNNTEQREITIDAQSARVLADERDQESSDPVAVDPQRLPPMDALALATALVPGSVESWALEFDDGRQRYSVDIRTPGGVDNDADVDVDVQTRAATRS